MRVPSLNDNVVGVTHTGRSIARNFTRRTVVCGGSEVTERELFENRPGKARQMRRMIARSRRRFLGNLCVRAPSKAVEP